MQVRTARLSERLGEASMRASVALLVAACLWLLGVVLVRGLPHFSLSFLFDEPSDAGRSGGIAPIFVSTLLIIGVQAVVVAPLSIGVGVFLAEISRTSSGFARLVRISLDIQAGIPSVVFGLFGNALFCQAFGLGFSIIAGGLTLATMVLPMTIRAVEEGLRAVPAELRMSTAALGFSRTAMVLRVLLPAAMPALATGMLLGIARALSETAALIFTSGYVSRMPTSLLDSGRALSVHIFDLSMNVPGGDNAAFSSALVLLLLLGSISSVSLLPALVRKVTAWRIAK